MAHARAWEDEPQQQPPAALRPPAARPTQVFVAAPSQERRPSIAGSPPISPTGTIFVRPSGASPISLSPQQAFPFPPVPTAMPPLARSTVGPAPPHQGPPVVSQAWNSAPDFSIRTPISTVQVTEHSGTAAQQQGAPQSTPSQPISVAAQGMTAAPQSTIELPPPSSVSAVSAKTVAPARTTSVGPYQGTPVVSQAWNAAPDFTVRGAASIGYRGDDTSEIQRAPPRVISVGAAPATEAPGETSIQSAAPPTPGRRMTRPRPGPLSTNAVGIAPDEDEYNHSLPPMTPKTNPQTPRAWGGNPTPGRRASIASLGEASLQRVNVSSLSRPGYESALGRRSSVATDRGLLPAYEKPSLCMLYALNASTGILQPPFSPDEFFYTLYVQDGVREVVIFPSSNDGVVLVDDHAPHLPVRLLGLGPTIVTLTVKSKSEMRVDGHYNVNVVFGNPPTTIPPKTKSQLFVAEYDFLPESNVEITLHKGDLIRVVDRSDEDWWFGCLVDGMGLPLDNIYGYFPSNYIRPLVLHEGDRRLTPLSETKRPDSYDYAEVPGVRNPYSQVPTPARIVEVSEQPVKSDPSIQQPIVHKADDHVVTSTDKSTIIEDIVKVPFGGTQWFTILVIGANLVMLMIALGMGGVDAKENPNIGPKFDTIQELGGRWIHDVLQGRVYLLVTQLFLPVGIIKFLVDAVFLWVSMGSLERVCGFVRTALIFLASGIIGNITGGFFVPRWLVTGCGSATFGSASALACIFINQRTTEGPSLLSKPERIIVGVCMGLSMILGTLPGQDNFSHIGGLFAGYLACLAFSSELLDKRKEVHLRFTLLGVVLMTFMFVMVCILLFLLIDINKPCSWCMKATCLPANDWCDASRLGGPFVNGTLITSYYKL